MLVHLGIGPGELFDRLTILELKHERVGDLAKRARVAAQLGELAAAVQADGRLLVAPGSETAICIEALRRINRGLWDVEAALREHERDQQFDDTFVALARSVYRLNDERAATKARIDALFGCPTGDVKDYDPRDARAAPRREPGRLADGC